MNEYYTIEQGDTLLGISLKFGFSDPEIILNHSNNEDFRNNLNNPNILEPGVKIFIPENKDMSITTGHSHQLAIPNKKQTVKLKLQDKTGNLLKNKTVTISYKDTEIEKKTDGEGLIEFELPAKIKEASVKCDDFEWQLKVGYLNPMDPGTQDKGTSGLQSRLYNIGYYSGKIDGDFGPKTTEAIKKFQADYGLEQSGELDEMTRNKITEVYGC